MKTIDYTDLSINFTLSEDFILNYKDKLSLGFVSQFQLLSEEFILNNQNIISFDRLILNKNCNYSENLQKLIVYKIIEYEFTRLKRIFVTRNSSYIVKNRIRKYYLKLFTSYMKRIYIEQCLNLI